MTYAHDCIVDLSELKGSRRVGEPPLQKIAKHVEALAKDVRHIGRGRLEVNSYTKEDREEERRVSDERIQRKFDNAGAGSEISNEEDIIETGRTT